MRKDLIVIKAKDKADWLNYQLLRTGGSTASALLGLNEYSSAAEVFYKYIGEQGQKQADNLPMLFGRCLEPVVRDLWQYWEGTPESMLANHAIGKKVQEVEYIDDLTILVSPDYPWLHCNLDGRIISNYEGREGILEIKTISSYAADKFQDGIPPAYIIQVHVYMIVTGYRYAEIAMLQDGRKFDVYPIEYNENIAEQIIERTKAFWDKVNLAKAIMASDLPRDAKLAEVAQYEPEVEDTKAYESFLKERFKANPELPAIEGSQEHWEWAQGHEAVKPKIKELEAEQLLYRNKLIRTMGEREVINFDEAGTVTYRANKNGARTLRINLK
jgi:predicted phage-related endonuclease